MAAVNDKIKAADYNAIYNKISPVLGVGSADTGWGQTVQSAAVTTSDSVTVNEYAALRYDVINAYTHLFNTVPSPAVSTQTIGAKIKYNLTDAPINYWNNLANTIVANKKNLAVAGQRRTVNHGTVNLTTTWDTELNCIITVGFTTAEAARFFFNSGGSFQFQSARTGGSGTNQNASWTTLLSTAGTRIFGGNTPGTGVSPLDGGNWFRMTQVRNQWSQVIASSPYALNEWRLWARALDVNDNSSGTSTVMEFYCQWVDNHIGLGGPAAAGDPSLGAGTYGPDAVDGTMSLTVQTVEPTGTLVPASAGNFNIETPTVTIGAINKVA